MLLARVRRNDGLILAAAVEVVANLGWGGLTLAGVGKAAGMTMRPVKDRYPSRPLLGAAAWTEVAGPALKSALADALASAGLLDHRADETAFAAAMDAFAMPSPELRAAAELAVVASFEPDLSEAVAATVGAPIHAWVNIQAAGSPTVAAKRGYLLAMALGLLGVAHRQGIPDLDLTPQWRRLRAALATECDPAQPQDEPRPPHLEFIPFDTGDPTTDNLLRAAIDQIGKHGYEGTLLASVAAEAHVSETTIYLRYPTKEAFFMDAINRHQDIAMPAQRAYLARLERNYGTGIAEAIAIRGTMHPSERAINVIDMERARLTWHRQNLAAADEDRLQQVVREVLAQDPSNPDFTDPARIHLGRALGVGIALLPLLCDEAWEPPYDVITIPMNET